MDVIYFIQLLVLGGAVGFIAGLLGIGGGGILVPVLVSMFIAQGVPVDGALRLSLGTAMAAIISTSFTSAYTQHKRQAVNWTIVRHMSPYIVLGCIIASALVPYLNTLTLSVFFCGFMAYLSINMLFKRQKIMATKQSGTSILDGRFIMAVVSTAIGMLSTFVAIGGGSLIVPYLVRRGIHINHAIACSAAIGVSIALFGTVGYIFNGAYSCLQTGMDQIWVLGFIHVPSVIIISFTGLLCAPIGVQLSSKVPQKRLKQLFGLLLLGISLKMLFNILPLL